MSVNGEGIYSTRPWKIYGEGPSTQAPAESHGRMGFNERGRKELTAGKVHHVELLGHHGTMKWVQNDDALVVQLPPEKPSNYGATLKVALR